VLLCQEGAPLVSDTWAVASYLIDFLLHHLRTLYSRGLGRKARSSASQSRVLKDVWASAAQIPAQSSALVRFVWHRATLASVIRGETVEVFW